MWTQEFQGAEMARFCAPGPKDVQKHFSDHFNLFSLYKNFIKNSHVPSQSLYKIVFQACWLKDDAFVVQK